jgi:hypothetical protein
MVTPPAASVPKVGPMQAPLSAEQREILDAITHATKEYSLTVQKHLDPRIEKALIQAHSHGIKLHITYDQSSAQGAVLSGQLAELGRLVHGGVPVHIKLKDKQSTDPRTITLEKRFPHLVHLDYPAPEPGTPPRDKHLFSDPPGNQISALPKR